MDTSENIFDAMRQKLQRSQEERESLTDTSENIFAKQDREREEERAKWRLSDLDPMAQVRVRSEADYCIRKHKITDDAEKQRVYDNIKAQYLTYEAERQAARNAQKEHRQSEHAEERVTLTLADIGITAYGDTEGEALENIDRMLRAWLRKTVQLEAEVKKLDERLKNLEKYTQE